MTRTAITQTNDTATLKAVAEAMNCDIAKHTRLAEEAFSSLEKMNIANSEFQRANSNFCVNLYIAGYLRNVKNLSNKCDGSLKMLENRIRFHAHAQRTKKQPNIEPEILKAEATVAEILEGYIERFFED